MVAALRPAPLCHRERPAAVAGRQQHETRTWTDYPMRKHPVHDFGVVDERGDVFEFHYGTGQDALCRLEAVVQTERGPKRTEIAVIPMALWRKVSARAVRELTVGMGETERIRKAPTMQIGSNRLNPLLGRELAVLLWALMEDGATEHVEGIL